MQIYMFHFFSNRLLTIAIASTLLTGITGASFAQNVGVFSSINIPNDSVFVVAKSGGEYTSIQAALNDIKTKTPVNSTTNAVVLVYPGVYREKVTVETTGVTVRGLSRDACVVLWDEGTTGIWGNSCPLWIKADLCSVENITVRNTAHKGPNNFPVVMAIKVNDTLTTFSRFDALNCRFEGDSGAVMVTGPWNTSQTTATARFLNCDLYGGDKQGKNVFCTYRGWTGSSYLGVSRSEWLGGRIETRYSPGGATQSPLIPVDVGCSLRIENVTVNGFGQDTLFGPVQTGTVTANNIYATGSVNQLAYSYFGTGIVNATNVKLANNITQGDLFLSGKLHTGIDSKPTDNVVFNFFRPASIINQNLDLPDLYVSRSGFFGEGYSVSGDMLRLDEWLEPLDYDGDNYTNAIFSRLTTGKNHFVADDNGSTVTTLARDGTFHTSGTIRTAENLISVGTTRTSGGLEVTGNANIYSGNIRTSGAIIATGNINTSGSINSTGAINTSGAINAAGPVYSGNITAAGNITATGNITASGVLDVNGISPTGVPDQNSVIGFDINNEYLRIFWRIGGGIYYVEMAGTEFSP